MEKPVELMINWHNTESHWLANPRLQREQLSQLNIAKKAAPALEAHIWLRTSGSTSNPKWVAISKSAFFASAESVNQHLKVNRTDIWGRVLPRRKNGWTMSISGCG